MEMEKLVSLCRSYRRFDAAVPVAEQTLRDLVSLARRTSSAANRQPLRYVLSCGAKGNDLIFPTLAWAGYLPEWGGPSVGERPTAYIVVLIDTRISTAADIDVGIASQTILLGAVERGLGGCIFGAVKRGELASRLSLPEHLSISVVIALGKPVEKIVLEGLPADGSIKYYRDPDGTHHVPKRSLEELIVSVYG